MKVIVVKPAARLRFVPIQVECRRIATRGIFQNGLALLVAATITGSTHAREPFCAESAAGLNCPYTTLADAEIHPATDDLLLVVPLSGVAAALPGTAEALGSVQGIPVAANPGSPRAATFPAFTLSPAPVQPPASTQAVADGWVGGTLGGIGGIVRSLAPTVQNAWRDLVDNLYPGQGAVRDWILAPLNTWLGLGGTEVPALASGDNQAGDEPAPRFDFALGGKSPDAPGDAGDDVTPSAPGGAVDSGVLDPYLAWLARNGLYADLSYRRPEPWGLVATGAQVKVTNAINGWSLETGYPLRTATGMVIEPRLQFSAAAVTFERLGNFFHQIEFDDRYSTQSRAGVQLRKTYGLSHGVRLTPSGSVNALTQVQGGNSFTTNDAGWNATDLNRTRLLLEGGLNAEFGRRTEVFGGMNYQDDGADDSLGGEMGVRVRW